MINKLVLRYAGVFVGGVVFGGGLVTFAAQHFLNASSYSRDLAQGWYTLGILKQLCAGDVGAARRVLNSTLDATTVSTGVSLLDLSEGGRAKADQLLREIKNYRAQCSIKSDDATVEAEVQRVLGAVRAE